MTTGELLYYAGIALLVLTIVLGIVFVIKKPKYQPENEVIMSPDTHTQPLHNSYPTNPLTVRRTQPENSQIVSHDKYIDLETSPLNEETVPLELETTLLNTETTTLTSQTTHLNRKAASIKTVAKTILLALMMGMIFCGCSKSPPENNWQQQYDLGVRYLSEGKYEEAIIAFTAAIQIDPKRSNAYTSLVDVYFVQGNYKKAAEILSQSEPYFENEQQLGRYWQALDLLENNKQGIFITDLRFDLDSYQAGKSTQFLVTVVYGCPANTDGVIMIGANTDEPDSFGMLNEDFLVNGNGRYQFHVEIVPKKWADAQFGIYVNLSEADHKDDWTPLGSDVVYFDTDGNISTDTSNVLDGNTEQDSLHGEEISAAIYKDPDFIKPEELTLGNIPFYEANLDQILASYSGFEAETFEIEQGILQCNIFSTNAETWSQGVSIVFDESQNNGLASSVMYIESSNGFYSVDDMSSPGVVPELRDIKLYDSAEMVFDKLGIDLQLQKVLLSQQNVALTAYSYSTFESLNGNSMSCEFFWHINDGLGVSLALSFNEQEQLQEMAYRVHPL